MIKDLNILNLGRLDRIVRRSIFALLVALTTTTFANSALAQNSGKELLEQKIHAKLERILTDNEYVLDIKIDATNASEQSVEARGSYLPGLQILGLSPENNKEGSAPIVLEGKADLLLILDKKVSSERAKVAQTIVTRIVESEGLKSDVKISVSQKDINKRQATELPQLPAKEPSILEQIIREKEFISRAVMVFWGAIVSLLAAYFLLRRFLLGNSIATTEKNPIGNAASGSTKERDRSLEPGRKSAQTRDELYSKDAAMLTSINEIKAEAREQPEKVATILSRWANKDDELIRSAAVFLKNCDMKTIELVCKAMHPSDLELVVAQKITEFEPFSAENARVIERMRSDFAILASEQVLRERANPLAFLKHLSDDDLCGILEGESADSVALVASQIPAHRLHKYYNSTSPERIKLIVASLSSMESASYPQFEALQELLSKKIETATGNLVSGANRLSSIQQMITSLPSPVLQCELIERLHRDGPAVFAKVRPSTFVATDLRFLSSRIKSLLIQSIDADTLGISVSDFGISFVSLIEDFPLEYQAVFIDSQSRHHDTAVVNQAWKKVSVSINELVIGGLVSKNEIASVVRRADSFVEKMKDTALEDEDMETKNVA